MKNLLKPLLILAVVAFAVLGINNIVSTNHKVELREVQLKSTTSDLKQLQLKYDNLNIQLDKALKGGQSTEQQLKQLQDEKTQLEQQKQELERQVSIKKQNAEAARVASVSATAYAASDPNSAKMYIYMHESGNNPGAINASSGACGLGQALPCSKMGCSLSDYDCQDRFFTGYAMARYGSWENAKAFWVANRWW